MALEHPQMMTVEEYFHLEETDTENRYEYIDGQVIFSRDGCTISIRHMKQLRCRASASNSLPFTSP